MSVNRKLLFASYCAKRFGVFAKALAETDFHDKGYSKEKQKAPSVSYGDECL